MDVIASFSRKFLSVTIFICCFHPLFAVAGKPDTSEIKLKVQSKPKFTRLDSLNQELGSIIVDSLKAPIYTQIALEYLSYNATKNHRQLRTYQNAAIKNTLSALHYFSKYDDSTGLRKSFDQLSSIYHAQHKYSPAKWFILQSNKISREQNDTTNVINSLIELSSIKTDIKDYTLAMKDLNEALSLAASRYPVQESEVQLHYAMLYNVLKNYQKAAIALKRHKAIDDSLRRAQARSAAQLAAKDSLQQVKKKRSLASSKKHYARKMASL